MLGKIPDPFASGGTSAMERKRELTRFTGGKVVVVGKRLAISLEGAATHLQTEPAANAWPHYPAMFRPSDRDHKSGILAERESVNPH